MSDTATFHDRVYEYLTRAPGQPIDGIDLAKIGGVYAWRTRVSEVRRRLEREGRGTIIWRDERQPNGTRRSLYTFLPIPKSSGQLSLLVLLVFLVAQPALATPITYQWAYTANTGSAPSFTFAFSVPSPITTTGLFALPETVWFDTGTAAGLQAFTHAGTNQLGWWIFGTAESASISDGGGGILASMGCHYLHGPCMAFVPDAEGWSGLTWGQTLWSADAALVARLDGRMTLAIWDAPAEPLARAVAPVPEDASGAWMLLVALGGLAVARKAGT